MPTTVRLRSTRDRDTQVGLVRELDADQVVAQVRLDKVNDVERIVPAVDGAVDECGAKDPLRVDERGYIAHRVDEVLGVKDVRRVGDGCGRLCLLKEGAV